MASWTRTHSNGWKAIVSPHGQGGKDWQGYVAGGHNDAHAPNSSRNGKSARRVMQLVDVMVGEHQHTCSEQCGKWTEVRES